MQKTFNIYCDESCHVENDHKKFMYLGAVKCAYPYVREYSKQISNLKKKYNFFAEIKWSKVSNSKLDFYIDLIELFFNTELIFRAIAIKKEKIDNQSFDQTYDLFYYKMYYQLLKKIISESDNHNIYLDIKDTLSAYKVRTLKKILNEKFAADIVRTAQNIRSHESILMQLADFLMGAVSYENNDLEHKNGAKMQIIERIKLLSKINNLGITNHDDKFNLFYIELR